MEANENNVRQSGTRIKVKTLKGMVPNYLTQLFNICNNDDYQLRSNNFKIYLSAKSKLKKKIFHIEVLRLGIRYHLSFYKNLMNVNLL